MSAEDYLGKNPKNNNERDTQGSATQLYQESLLTPILVLAVLRYYQLLK